MKFKVGQKVRMKQNEDEAQEGDIGIIRGKAREFGINRLYAVEFPCFKESGRGHTCGTMVPSGNGHYITEEYLESFPQTLEDKLELFKAGTHVLYTPTQEIYDKLMVELEKRGYALVANEPLEVAKDRWRFYRNETCIRYAPDGQYYGKKGVYVGRGKEIIELTPEDFRMGNAHRVSDSEQEEHMKITIETDGHHKTTAECNGITAESLCNPTDEFKLPKGVHMAVQRLLEKLKEPEEDTGFHVGDIVEVVDADGYRFFEQIRGIQGVIVSNCNGDVCKVKFPFVVDKKDTWSYFTQALKLIRRGNN